MHERTDVKNEEYLHDQRPINLAMESPIVGSSNNAMRRSRSVFVFKTCFACKILMAKSVKSNVINNLDLLPSGPIPPNPSELLASNSFKQLLEQFSGNYDYVIIDTPPINVVSDAMVMKGSISGIMLVIRYAMTTYEELANCMK